MDVWKQSPEHIYVAAHRGWSAKYPENTMAAFRAALELGVDQIETDVRVTKDGRLVLIHDGTVDRTTDGSGRVCDLTFEELRRLDAGNGEHILLLSELLELIRNHPTVTLDIELKEYPEEGKEELAFSVCDRTLRMLEEYGVADRCVINTFSGRLHDHIHDACGGRWKQHVYYPVQYLGACAGDPYQYGYCTCVFGVVSGEVSVGEVRRLAEETGIRIWAGRYADNEERIDLAVAMGAELITCDNPDEVLAILRRKGLHP